jgi:DNA-binding IclR family transcriptional regulator
MNIETTSTAVERALSILEEVAGRTDGMTNSEISRKLEIPKSSASYILRVLEKRGYLVRGNTNRYKLGLRIVGLGRGLLLNLDVREVAKPLMKTLTKKIKLSTHLAVLDNGRAVYVEKVDIESFIKMDIWVGHRLPVHTTAIGKALIANLSEDKVSEILELRGMEKKSSKTITNKAKFLQELAKVREYGFALDNEENNEGVRCVAAPVFNATGEVIAALGTSGTSIQMNDANLSQIAESVRETAHKVSRQMGFANS